MTLKILILYNFMQSQQLDSRLFSSSVFERVTYILNNNLCLNSSLNLFSTDKQCEEFADGIGKTVLFYTGNSNALLKDIFRFKNNLQKNNYC
jgi:hypothetical protein